MKKSNLVFIFSDQHRKFDLSCYGNEDVITPNLDKLASEGIKFNHCYSNSPVCVPARGSILTGLYAQNHGAFTNDIAIRYDVESIADVLKENGYETAYIGKWHLCGIPRDQMIDEKRRLGFEEWKVANCNHNYLHCYYDDKDDNRYWKEGYEPEIFGELAREYIRKPKEKPFALFLSFASPHDPHDCIKKEYKMLYNNRSVNLRHNVQDVIMRTKKEFITKEEQKLLMKGYYGHISAIDNEIGKIINLIDQLAEDTLIVYTSDHGDMLGSHGVVDKQTPYEEAIAVPLILRWKGKIKQREENGLIGLVDLPVTLVSILGGKFSGKVDGKDMSDLVLNGKKLVDECYLYDLYPCHQAEDKGYTEWRGIRTSRYTYSIDGKGEDWLFFDNKLDPYQEKNLIADKTYSNVKEKLRERLMEYVEQYDGIMTGEEYIRYIGKVNEFNISQQYFQRKLITEK